MKLTRSLSACLILGIFGGLTSTDARPPSWLNSLRKVKIPTSLDTTEADAIILRSEYHTQVSRDGVFRSTISGAIKVKNFDGYKAASAGIPYLSDTDKIISFSAWTIPAKGKTITYRQDDFVDAVAANYKNVATTSRVRSISAKDDMRVDSIFAYEAVVESRAIFSQKIWHIQTQHPTLLTRMSFEIEADWEIKPTFFNAPDFPAQVTKSKRGKTFHWTQALIDAVELEPASPSMEELAMWAAFDLIPPAKNRRKHYASWNDISVARTPVFESFTTTTPQMRAKVDELTANTSTRLETIKVLSEFAQSINYISVALNLGEGGGYTPRPADQVFDTLYGDCKDKTNLLHALLKIKGIDMYPLIVKAGQSKVFAEWPSGMQFNHCVAAIAVDDSIESTATIDHPELGTLLVFDPTSVFTPFGDIPYEIQDSEGIILAGGKGGLVSVPPIDLSQSLLRRNIDIEVMPSGVAIGVIEETATGQASKRERQFAFTSENEYAQLMQDWISKYNPGAQIGEVTKSDNRTTGEFSATIPFKAPSFSKNMRNVLLIFKPVMINRTEVDPFNKEERKHPVDLRSYNLEETIRIFLPPNFEISEIPDDIALKTNFASYELKFQINEDSIIVNRDIKIHPERVALEEMESLKEFLADRIKADHSSIVLEKS